MNDIRTFHAPNLQLQQLIQAVVQWYQSQQFEVQTAPLSDATMLQARQQSGWRSAIGTSSALQVVFRPHGDDLVIEIGAGKWSDKAAAGAVGWFLLWPLAFTAAYGAWQQSHLPDRTFEFIERYLAGGIAGPSAYAPTGPPAGGTAQAPAPPAGPPATQPATATATQPQTALYCSKCGQALPAGSQFCNRCGAAVVA